MYLISVHAETVCRQEQEAIGSTLQPIQYYAVVSQVSAHSECMGLSLATVPVT